LVSVFIVAVVGSEIYFFKAEEQPLQHAANPKAAVKRSADR